MRKAFGNEGALPQVQPCQWKSRCTSLSSPCLCRDGACTALLGKKCTGTSQIQATDSAHYLKPSEWLMWAKFEDFTALIREGNLNSFPSRLCRAGNFQQGSSELAYSSFQHHGALVCLCKNYLNWPAPSKLWAVLVSEIHVACGKEYQSSPHMCTSLSMRQPQLRQWPNMWQRPRQKCVPTSGSMISTACKHTPLFTQGYEAASHAHSSSSSLKKEMDARTHGAVMPTGFWSPINSLKTHHPEGRQTCCYQREQAFCATWWHSVQQSLGL